MATISAVPQQITPAASHLERITQAVSNRDLLKWMFQFVKPVKHMMALTGAYLALLVGAEILTVRQTARAVDQIKALHLGDASTQYGFWHWISSSSWDAIALRNTILLLAIFAGAMGLLRYLREVSNSKLSMRMVFYIRQAVYDKLQRVGFSFHDAVSTGQLISRALTDLQNVRMFVQSAVLTSLEIVLIVGGYIVLILTRSPWVALLALVPMPFWTWYILRFSKKAQPSWKAVLEADDRNVSILTENIAGVHVVKAFATEKQEVDKYNKNADTFYQRTIARIRLFANFQPIIRAIASASNLTLFLAAGILMIKQKLNVGDFLILGAAMGSILGRLQQVSVINDQYQAAVVSAKRLYEVLMAPPTVPEKPNAPALPAGGGAVRFEDVSFGYDPNRPV
ncbi:MAG TPA: ABC transporter transmembrane domain-containing protein, partial [Tepidisphaeraceae bacterium]